MDGKRAVIRNGVYLSPKVKFDIPVGIGCKMCIVCWIMMAWFFLIFDL